MPEKPSSINLQKSCAECSPTSGKVQGMSSFPHAPPVQGRVLTLTLTLALSSFAFAQDASDATVGDLAAGDVVVGTVTAGNGAAPEQELAQATPSPAQTQPAQSQTAQTQNAQAQAAQPFTLEAALAQLAKSPSVTQAQLSVQVAQANLNAARTALGLTVSVNGNAGYSGSYDTVAGGVTTTMPSDTSGSAGINASLGILPWSTNQTTLRTAQRSLTLAQARLVSAQSAAQLNVAQQYFAAVLASQDTELAGRTLALRQRQLSIAQTQQANGNATPESVLSAQAAVQSAQAGQLQAAANLEAARLSLGAALGTPLGNVTFTSQPTEPQALPDVNALVIRARTQRVDAVDAQNTLSAAQDTLDLLRRDTSLPDLTASVRYGPAGSGGLTASLNLKQGTLGAGYNVPFNGTSSPDRFVASITGSYVIYSPSQRAQLSAAQANVTQAQLSLSVTQQTAELDVRTKYSAAQTSLIAVQTRATQVQVASLTLDASRTRLEAGTGTQDDVTNAEINLAQAQRDLQNARITAQLALIQLINAAGGTP